MKKIAIRAGVILAIVVACSMFFAQTIVTITTPKVKYMQAGYKKFEEKLPLSGTLYFAKTDKITLDEAAKTPITVERMFVRTGDMVNEGDTICTTKLSGTFNDEVDAASEGLVKAREAYSQHEIENIKLVDHTDSDKNEAFRAVNDTAETLAKAQSELLSAAAKLGLMLPEDATQWAALVQQQGDDNLTSLMEAVIGAQSKAAAANEAFLSTFQNSKTKKEVYDFLNNRAKLQHEVDKAQNALVQLVATGNSMTTIRAKHAGYIVSLGLAEGQTYSGGTPAYELNAVDSEPVLRVEITGMKREFAEGMRADIKGEYDDIRSKVAAIVREGVDKKYLHIELTNDIITSLGGVRALLEGSTTVSITYKAKDTTTVLPAEVVRDEGSDKTAYVYIAEDSWGGMWGSSTVARKMPVTVIDRGDKEVSIREDLRHQRIVYREDRAISDGGKIMEYVD